MADGYEVEALDFLLKSVQYDKLCQALNRALIKLESAERALIVESEEGRRRVPLYEIRYLDVYRNYVTIHAQEELTTRSTLSQVEAELDGRFFRVGRSAIVNLTKIARVTRKEIVLLDDERIALPRGYYNRVHLAMIENL